MEKQRQDLLRAKDEYLLKIRMMGQYTGADTLAICENIGNGGATSQNRGGQGGASVPASSLSTSLQRDHRGRGASIGTHKNAILVEGLTLSKCQTDSQGLFSSPAVLIMAKKRRVMAQVITMFGKTSFLEVPMAALVYRHLM